MTQQEHIKDLETVLTDAVDQQRLLAIAEDLIRLESEAPPGREAAVGEYIVSFLERLGCQPQRQYCAENRFNVLARISGKAPVGDRKTLLYCGHIDVVPAGDHIKWVSPPYEPQVREGRLFGRGSCDMKGSIACMLYIVELLMQNHIELDHDLLLVLDADEEQTNLGIRRFLQDETAADWILVGEPTSLEIAVGHRGVMAFDVAFHGKSVHAAQYQQGHNALYDAAEFCRRVQGLNQSLRQRSFPYIGQGTVNVTMIGGGTKFNIIPDSCSVRVDRRLVKGETKESALSEIEDLLSGMKIENPAVCYDISLVTHCPPGLIDESCALVSAAKESVRKVLRTEPVVKGFEATCEAGVLIEGLGAPAMIFGPGSIAQAHNVDEFIPLQQLFDGARVYISLLCRMLMAR